jgi:hypothetical protein
MYVDLVDESYNSLQFNLTETSLGPLDQPISVVKDYLSLLSSFILVFYAKADFPDGHAYAQCLQYHFTQTFTF